LRTTDHHWLAWVSFIPLFAAVRSLRPSMAAMAGAFWGFCLYLFCIAGATPVIEPSLFSLTLLTVIPAVYTGLAALASRAIGFSPVMLAFGWILVEVALKPLGLHHGLLAGAQGDGVLLHWVGRMLGYVFVAFLVVCANASLLMLLSSVRISIPRIRSLAGLTDSQACLAPRVFVRATSVAMGQAYPRAPPI
jgi:apolipoprotein N-acyltransferase